MRTLTCLSWGYNSTQGSLECRSRTFFLCWSYMRGRWAAARGRHPLCSGQGVAGGRLGEKGEPEGHGGLLAPSLPGPSLPHPQPQGWMPQPRHPGLVPRRGDTRDE